MAPRLPPHSASRSAGGRPQSTRVAPRTNLGSRHPRRRLCRGVRAPSRDRRCGKPRRSRTRPSRGSGRGGHRRTRRRPRSRTARMNRGDLVTVALQGKHGKPRPALVIRSDLFANLTSTVTIALLTSADLDIPIFPRPRRALRNQRAAHTLVRDDRPDLLRQHTALRSRLRTPRRRRHAQREPSPRGVPRHRELRCRLTESA